MFLPFYINLYSANMHSCLISLDLEPSIWYAAASSDSGLKFGQIMTIASSGGHLRCVASL